MRVDCEGCGKPFKIRDEVAAKPKPRVRCPRCKHVFRLAAPAPAGDADEAGPPELERGPGGQGTDACATHPDVIPARACPECDSALCGPCVHALPDPSECPYCGGDFMVPELAEMEIEAYERRKWPLVFELPLILVFPLTSPLLLLGLVIIMSALNVFSLAPFSAYGFAGQLLGFAVLMTMTFYATIRAADGDRTMAIGDIGGSLGISESFLLGMTVLAAAYGPPIGVYMATESLLFTALTLLWTMLYMPMALTIAALTRSVTQVLNPFLGLKAMWQMGLTYVQVLFLIALINLPNWAATGATMGGVASGYLPLWAALPILAAIQSYTFLAIGAMIGIAVDKRAVELGMA